jgi:hypothetical protein
VTCCRESSNHQQHSVGSLGILTGKVEREERLICVLILVLLHVLLGVLSLSLLLSISSDRTSEFSKRAGSG